jgi:cytochrome c
MVALSAPAFADTLGIGRPAHPDEIAAWDVNVMPGGAGLPEGEMSVWDGEQVFIDNCAACHGDFAEGLDNWPPLAGGRGTLTAERPLKTVGSYWPHLSTVWDYVHRSMPYGNAQMLTADEVYGIVAYILYSEGLVEDDFVLSKDNFGDIVLPNNDGFYVDDREEAEFPLFTAEPCMSDCKDTVEITRRAADLNVTPRDDAGRIVSTIPSVLAVAGDAAEAAVEPAVAEEPAPEPTPAAGPDPELIAAGEKAFAQCKTCHEVGDGARNKTGPHLNALFGRVAGSVEGFRYSRQFTAAGDDGLVWTEETLAEFLTNPRDYIKGTRMSFRGFRDAADVGAVTAYLKTFAEE